MKLQTFNEQYGTITYDENFWTGKRKLTINGVTLMKSKKNVYMYSTEESIKTVQLKGNFMSGVYLLIDGVKVELSEKTKWYETLFAILPLILVFTWGNSPELCAIFPIIGGAVGGGVAAGFAILNIYLMKSTKNPLAKMAIGFTMMLGTIFVCFILALIVGVIALSV